MTDTVIHLFTLDMSEAEVVAAGLATLVPGHALTVKVAPRTLIDLLGTDTIAPSACEIFDVAELVGIKLSEYLLQGMPVDAAQLDADRTRLDAIRGYVLLVYVSAGDPLLPVPPTTDPRLTFIGSYTEVQPAVRVGAAPDLAPAGPMSHRKPPKSDARIGGMVATVVLLGLGVFVFLLVWTAG